MSVARVVTHLEREIAAQGDVVRRRLAGGGRAAAEAARLIRGVGHLVIAARGSSDNAARFAQYLLGARVRLVVSLATPSLYADPDAAPRLPGAAVLAISQSGQSPDVVAVLAAARAQGRPTIALTNDLSSPLARQADAVIPMLAGQERSVAATGTYAASLVAIAELADALAPAAGPSLPVTLRELADALDRLAARELELRERYDLLDAAVGLTVVGRGIHYATAHETALKLRELSGTPAEGFSPADLMHGPIAAVGANAAVWMIEPGEGPNAVRAKLAERLATRGSTLVTVGAGPAPVNADLAIRLPRGPGWREAVTGVVPAQVAALRLAELRGVDPDAPHGLSKVTRTT